MENILEKVKALSTAEKLIAAGGIVLFIASLFAWYTVSVDAGVPGISAKGSESGWGDPASIWSILAVLVGLALAGIVIATRVFDVAMPALPQGVTWGLVYGGGAAAVVVLMLLKAWRIMANDCPAILEEAGCDTGFGFGFYLGVIATIAIAAGGYLMYSQEKAGMTAR